MKKLIEIAMEIVAAGLGNHRRRLPRLFLDTPPVPFR